MFKILFNFIIFQLYTRYIYNIYFNIFCVKSFSDIISVIIIFDDFIIKIKQKYISVKLSSDLKYN